MDGNDRDRLPLEGVRVVEIAGGVAAAFASRQMAGYGAEVARVEGGSDLPPLTDEEEVYLVAGKQRVDVNRVDLRSLALAADIVVEEGSPGRLDAFGASPSSLRDAKPSLVVVSISPFGQTGPYRNYRATNIVSFAMGGIMSLTGDFHREPLVSGGSQAQYFGGLHAFGAAVTAHLGAVLQGEGDWVDISLQECAAGTLELYGPMTEYGGPIAPRLGNQSRAEWGIYPCVDGYVGLFALQRQVPALFEAMGDPNLIDEGFLDPMYRTEHHEELAARIYVFTSNYTKAELLEIGRKHRVPIGVAVTPLDLLNTESLAGRSFWDDITLSGDDGEVRVPGRTFTGVGWQPLDRLHEPGADTNTVRKRWLEEVSS